MSPRAARAKKVKPPKVIVHAPDAPEVVQAAQIALISMKAAGVHTWEEFTERTDEELRLAVSLTAEQQGLLEEHRHILPHLRVMPLVSVAGCDTCGRYGLVTSAAVPAKCAYTLRCAGTVSKASIVDYRNRRK